MCFIVCVIVLLLSHLVNVNPNILFFVDEKLLLRDNLGGGYPRRVRYWPTLTYFVHTRRRFSVGTKNNNTKLIINIWNLRTSTHIPYLTYNGVKNTV